MAKKKKASSKKVFVKYGSYVILLFVLASIGMLFLDWGKYVATLLSHELYEEYYTGIQMIFGYSKKVGDSIITYFMFDIIGLLAYVLLIVGVVVSFIKPLKKSRFILAGVIALIGAVLIFVAPYHIQFNYVNTEKYMTFQIGWFLSGLFATLSGATGIVTGVIK